MLGRQQVLFENKHEPPRPTWKQPEALMVLKCSERRLFGAEVDTHTHTRKLE